MRESYSGDERRIQSLRGGRAARGPYGGGYQRTVGSNSLFWQFVVASVARWSPGPLALRLCCVSHLVDMDVALFTSDSSKPQLAAGVAAKLIDAAAANGPLVVPTSTGAVAGQQFRMLAGLAGLDATESFVLTGWLEDAYGPSIAERYARELPNVNVSQALTSLAHAPQPARLPGYAPSSPSASAQLASSAFANLMGGGPPLHAARRTLWA